MLEKAALRLKMRALRDACTDRAARDERLLANILALPAYKSAEGSRMDFFRIDAPEALAPGAFGILEPPALPERRFMRPDKAICFVPGLAFTRQGNRLGWGKGYYDTFLSEMPVCTVGLCYDFQLVEFLPAEVHDKPVSYICTDRDLCICTSSEQDRKDGLKI